MLTRRLVGGICSNLRVISAYYVPSWNQIVRWLGSMAELQRAGIAAA
jgi:hypothetical protein